jgi:hypothetical protein
VLQHFIAPTGLEEAVGAWRGILTTPAYSDVGRKPLPIFRFPETFQAIPLVAKAGLPFLVLAASESDGDGVQALLDGLGVSPEQYRIRRVGLEEVDLNSALAQAQQEFSHYKTYLVDPNQPHWLQDLLAGLEEEGVLPIGDLAPALQATDRYFKTLA